MCMECVDIVEKAIFCISHMNIKMTIYHVVNVVKPVVKKIKLKKEKRNG